MKWKMTAPAEFFLLSDDLLLKILFKLQDDPRNWARLACVCSKFSSLLRNACWKSKCKATIPAVVADLLPSPDSAVPGGWSALHKLAVCCPGLLHSGVLLEHSDFGGTAIGADPVAGHRPPGGMVELAKLLVHRYNSLSVVLLAIKSRSTTSKSHDYINSISAAGQHSTRLSIIQLPNNDDPSDPNPTYVSFVESKKPQVKDAVSRLISTGQQLAGFVLDVVYHL